MPSRIRASGDTFTPLFLLDFIASADCFDFSRKKPASHLCKVSRQANARGRELIRDPVTAPIQSPAGTSRDNSGYPTRL